MATKKKIVKKAQKKVVKKKVFQRSKGPRYENIDLLKFFKTGIKEHSDDWAFIEGNILSVITNHPKPGDSTDAAIKVDGYVIINGDDVGDNVGDFGEVQDKLQDFDENEITTSFQCMKNAGINFEKIKVLETVKDLDITVERGERGFDTFQNNVPAGATYKEYPDHDYDLDEDDEDYDERMAERIVTKRYHRAGGMLIREGKFSYICGMDEDSYFVTKLTGHPKTMDLAFEGLKPKVVLNWEKKNKEFAIRQGEWFFLPSQNQAVKGMRRKGLPLWEKGGNKHMVSSHSAVDGKLYCKSYVTHPDHETINLGNVIHEAIMNTQKGSWSIQGVD